jgi:hypothetical protein
MKDDKHRLRLAVELTLRDTDDEALPRAVAYAYDIRGRFLAASSFEGDSCEATLDLPAELAGHQIRLLVGPDLADPDQRDDKSDWRRAMLRNADLLPPERPAMETLRRLGAVERTIRLTADLPAYPIAVFPVDWQRWLTCHCVVRGRLVKQVPMPDGTVQDWGVCHACVLVYEVDALPRIIARLPDVDIYRIRDELLREIPWPPVVGPPQPDPPGPLPPFARASADQATVVLSEGTAMFEPVALASSASQLRQVYIEHADLIIRWLCAWPWFMRWFSRDLLAIACTDDRGHFETTITYPCFGDHPDLYFRAVQWTGGSLHWLYDPGMRCHTHWNYPCGTEVTLVTHDPAAMVCEPPEPVDPPPGVGTWVLINRVGGILIDSIGADGLVGYDFIDGSGHTTATGAPFGGSLGLRVSHSADIPHAGLRYYRWLYNKDGDVDSGGDPIWTEFAMPVAGTVGRHYADFDQANPGQPPTFPIYTLGPKGVGGLTMYEFRPQPAELQALAPPDHTWQWPIEAVGNDIYSARLDSTSLPGGLADAVGLYHFKLEVRDDTGALVAPGAGTFRFIVLTSGDGDTRLPTAGEVQDGGFVFSLHLDNRRCEAVIDAPSVGGVGADPDCGFLKFAPGDVVDLDFHALQPHTDFAAPPTDRATFHFWMRRGAHVIQNVSGEVAAPSAGAWTGDFHGNFQAGFTPGALLGPCKQAAFAEILRVHAKATNGWRRLSEYDAGTEWAFALTPSGPGIGPGGS